MAIFWKAYTCIACEDIHKKTSYKTSQNKTSKFRTLFLITVVMKVRMVWMVRMVRNTAFTREGIMYTVLLYDRNWFLHVVTNIVNFITKCWWNILNRNLIRCEVWFSLWRWFQSVTNIQIFEYFLMQIYSDIRSFCFLIQIYSDICSYCFFLIQIYSDIRSYCFCDMNIFEKNLICAPTSWKVNWLKFFT